MQQDDIPDLPLYTPSTGKLKGGPKKVPDVKPTKAAKLPKVSQSSPGSKSGKGIKAPKASPKISVPKARNEVRPHLGTKKADTKFSLPKPSMPKAKMSSSKMKRR